MGSAASIAIQNQNFEQLVSNQNDIKISVINIKQIQEILDKDTFDRIRIDLNKHVDTDGNISYEQLKCIQNDTIENEKQELHLHLNYEAIKSLWFTPAHNGRGRSLVELTDTINSLYNIIHSLYHQNTSEPTRGMLVSEFLMFISKSNCDIDENTIINQFYECTKYPADEDDEVEVISIVGSLGAFASALVRISNTYELQENGQSDLSLTEQLLKWIESVHVSLGINPVDLQWVGEGNGVAAW